MTLLKIILIGSLLKIFFPIVSRKGSPSGKSPEWESPHGASALSLGGRRFKPRLGIAKIKNGPCCFRARRSVIIRIEHGETITRWEDNGKQPSITIAKKPLTLYKEHATSNEKVGNLPWV